MKHSKRKNSLSTTMKVVIVFIALNIFVGATIDLSNHGDVETLETKAVPEETALVQPEENVLVQTQEPEVIIKEEPVETNYVTIPEKEAIDLSKITEYSATKERILALFDFFISEGFTPEATAGIIGNIAVESCFDPSVMSGSGYMGLCQWNTSDGGAHWWDGEGGISNWLAANGYPWNSFEGQAKAILYCKRRGFLSDDRVEELKGLKSVEQATELFCVFYESCPGGNTLTQYYNVGNYYQGLDTRISEAYEALRIFYDPNSSYNGEKIYPGELYT